MKYLLYSLSLFIYCNTAVADYSGEFNGQEKFDVKCTNPSLNNNGIREWNAVHSEVKNGKYEAVINTDGGTYHAVGLITNNTAIGEFEGKDAFGNDCNGQFSNTIIGDSFKGYVRGSCPKIRCNFSGDITAKRKPEQE